MCVCVGIGMEVEADLLLHICVDSAEATYIQQSAT